MKKGSIIFALVCLSILISTLFPQWMSAQKPSEHSFMASPLTANRASRITPLAAMEGQDGLRLFELLGPEEVRSASPSSVASVRERAIIINFDALDESVSQRLRIPLLDGKVYEAVLMENEGFSWRGPRDFTWRGYLDGKKEWSVTLSIKERALSGLIYSPTGVYEIIPQRNFEHLLVELDQSRFPRCGGELPVSDKIHLESDSYEPDLQADSGHSGSVVEDSGGQIDVMVVYTPAVRVSLGGTSQTQSRIQLSVDSTNLAYFNSQISPRLRLVHTQEISYTESGNLESDLNWVNFDATVRSARDSRKADLVSLIVNNGNGCGIARLMSNVSYDFDFSSYSVVVNGCAVGNLSFAHELGHNQGSGHNPEDAFPGTYAYPFAFGHYVPNSFRTIMSYETSQCQGSSCPRVTYFSNPSVTYNGQPMGTNTRDNHRVINNTAYTVANFRDTSGCTFRAGENRSGNELTSFQYAYVTGGSFLLGCPNALVRTDGFTSFAGTVSHYQTTTGGDIEYHANGSRAGQAFAVLTPFLNKWASFGFSSNNPLGYPIGFTSQPANSCYGTQNRYQSFEGGSLSQHLSGPRNGQVFEVHGAIHRRWELGGFAVCPLGMPTSDETTAQPSGASGSTGKLNQFEGGQIYWKTNAAEAFEVHGVIYSTYVGLGGSASWLGFPISNEYAVNGRARSDFEAGYITTLDGVNYQAFPYTGCPGSASASPSSGQVGSSVTLTGNSFTGVNSVRFTNNVAAQFTVNSTNQITTTVPSGATTGSIIVGKTGCANTQTNVFTVTLATIPVTVTTNPLGGSFSVDGGTFTSSQTFNWQPGSSHSISTTSPQGNSQTRYNWSNWSDGGAISHSVAPTTSTTYTANFTTQHFLTMNAGTGGGVSPSSGWHNAGQTVQISAAPNSGYTFNNWTGSGSGSFTGASNPVTLTMNGPITETGSFTPVTRTLTVASSNPSSGVGITISLNDNDNQGSGTTQFTRLYNNNITVTLTAPATAGGNNFQKWQRDGADWSFNQSTSVAMDANHTMTVIYATPSVELARIGCSQESSLRSIESITLSSIQFINNSAESVKVFWIDYSGQRVLYRTLNSGQGYVQGSYLTQPWVVTNLADACLGIYLPVSQPGQATITSATPMYFISGRVNYAGSATGVMNAGLSLSGSQSANVITDANGLYAFDGLAPGGNFTLTSSKVGAVSGINTTDATRILQFIAGTFTLSGNQQMAADTSQNGTINTTDVTHILNFIAANPAVANNRTGEWRFNPPIRSYTSLATNQTGQNYDALLLGEVSGNWNPAAPSIEVAKSGEPVAAFGREATATPCGAPPTQLSLPNSSVGSTVTNFTLPITIGDTTGESVTGYNLRFSFDPAVVGLQATPVSTAGTLSSGMSFTTNTDTPGLLTVVAAQASPLTGSGTLLNVNFTRLGAQGTSTALTWEVSELNDAVNDCIKPATPINGNINIAAPTAAHGVVSGRITAVDGRPVSGAVIQLTGWQSRKTITDANGDYRFHNVETAGLYTLTPSRANFNFRPTARFFSQLGGRTEAVFSGSFTGDALNPLDTAEYFVRQQYVDILGREPDEGGFNYWSDRILECGSNQLCENVQRHDVAAAFYIEAEFQQTGAFIYGLYRSSLGRRPAYAEYTSDRRGIMAGGNPEGNEAALAEGFVQRAEFVVKYQANQTAESFVDALLQTVREAAGVELGSEREDLIEKYNEGSNLNQSRGSVLRAVSKAPAFKQAEYNGAFVLTEYFGYLRRDPDPGGYDFWLDVLNNRDPANFRGMVCAFITSREYQERFSPIVTRFNTDCGP